MNDRYQIVTFADGRFVVDQRQLPRKVAGACDDAHGDLKTASVRKFPILRKGESVELREVWTNLYGLWARVRIDGRDIDVRPSSIIFDPKESTP